MVSLSAASHTLGNSAIGTGTLNVSRLFNVDGWVAVVTGGGTGLGLITAAALAENGAKVYITGRRGDVLEQAALDATPKSGNGKVIAIQADVATKEGILKLRDAIAKEETHINLLVNNHGVSQGAPKIDDCEQTPEGISKTMFEDETFERWAETYRINTTSYYFTSFAFLPLLAAAKKVSPEPGNILNISSMSGITRTSQRGQINYNASKAATLSVSDQLATEFARRNLGIRVNTLCPGYFPTGMTTILPDDQVSAAENAATFRGSGPGQWGIPLARPGNAVDYAQCIFGVVTNQYQTGSHIVIDGGWLLECAF